MSTGALVATYAFLGPEYDATMARMYTSVTDRDVYRKRPRVAVLFTDSAASSEPLRQLIDAQVDDALLAAIARGHAADRRLYVGTTNIDTRRLVVWDMGAIAASGRPDAKDLYRKVTLASASVPAFFPPVPIGVEVIHVLLPLTDNDGNPLPGTLFRTVAEESADKFDGLTARTRAPAEGRWKDGSSGTDEDDIVIYEVMAEERDGGWRKEYRGRLEK